jgi:hypothetical protein
MVLSIVIIILYFVDRAHCYDSCWMTNLTHDSFYVFISILYMFRATPCSSSGESIVSIQHLVYVTLSRWSFHIQVTDLHTKRSRARGCSKYVENWNKYIEKNCASCRSFTKNHVYLCYHRWQVNEYTASIGGGVLTGGTEVSGLQASTSTTLPKQIPYRLTWDQTRTSAARARSLSYRMSSDRQLIQQPQKERPKNK